MQRNFAKWILETNDCDACLIAFHDDESEDLMDIDTFFKDDNGKWTFITNENIYFLNYCLRKQPNNN